MLICSILAAYDLGATAEQLAVIYDSEKEGLDPIHLADRKSKAVEQQHVQILPSNWTEYLGQEKSVIFSECVHTSFLSLNGIASGIMLAISIFSLM